MTATPATRLRTAHDSGRFTIPSMDSMIPAPYRTEPLESNLSPSSGRISYLNIHMDRTATMAIGTMSRKRLCHPKTSFRAPPIGGPAARPTKLHIVCNPMAPPLRSAGKTSAIIEMLVVDMAAAPAPIITLHAIRNENEGVNTTIMEATAITATPVRNTLLFP